MRRRARIGNLVFEKHGAAADKLALARAMRTVPTEAEGALWRALRERQLDGWKFRRQHVIAGYIVDFYCAELWLAVEVDGPIHNERRAEDQTRDADLARLGVRIVRLGNDVALNQLDVATAHLARVCEEIAQQRVLLPAPAPRGRASALRRGSGGGGR